MRKMIGLTCLAWLLSAASAAAQADAQGTGCEYARFQHNTYVNSEGQLVFDDARVTVVARKLDTPVFKDATDNSRLDVVLRFSQRVRMADPGAGPGVRRIKVKDIDDSPIGWVDRNDVLCRMEPLTDRSTGLYRRAVVRTEPTPQGQPQIKKVFHSTDGRCQGGSSACVEVSRFQWYFIYGEEAGHYLISEAANLGSEETKLLGWIPIGDAYNWNTSLGLRPSEQLATRPRPPDADEAYVCAYETLADLSRGHNCSQVLGGRRWFGKQVRMQVLKEENQIYEVIFSNAQTAGVDVSAAVDRLKNLDVFFVIDGTKSMQPAIDHVKELVASLQNQLRVQVAQGAIVRYGFRIYRDSAKGGADGISNSESLVLRPDQCGSPTNDKEFIRSLQAVKALDSQADDDYPENTYGGIAQASEDIAACPNHLKLVFVVGDHGYSAAKQQARGHRVWNEAQIAARFRFKKGQGQRFNVPPIVMFIQTQSLESIAGGNKEEYRRAYEGFEQQAKSILELIYSSSDSDFKIENPKGRFFVRLQSGGTPTAVAEKIIKEFVQPEFIAGLGTRVRAGESLKSAIERTSDNSSMNIPILFQRVVEEALCQRLGPQCRTAVLESVNKAFVKNSDDLEPEVLLSRRQLAIWNEVLEKIKVLGTSLRGQAARNQAVNALLQDLGVVLQIDVDNTPVPLHTLLQFKAGLPSAGRSKLMQYSTTELYDSNLVPDCEIDFLTQYGGKKHSALKIVYEGDGRLLADFQEGRWPPGACANLTEKGRSIPFIGGDVRPLTINRSREESAFTIMHKKGNEEFFWIPVRYMP